MGYWVSFLDGLQHVVLFTENKAIRDHVLCGNRTERAHLEVTLSLVGMGLSLVDDVKGLELRTKLKLRSAVTFVELVDCFPLAEHRRAHSRHAQVF